MIKVINLVSLLAAPIMIQYRRMTPPVIIIVLAMLAASIIAIWYSKRTGEKEAELVEESVSHTS
jgi:K(+)-stimulated pyrophosphate-energized sodium pump